MEALSHYCKRMAARKSGIDDLLMNWSPNSILSFEELQVYEKKELLKCKTKELIRHDRFINF